MSKITQKYITAFNKVIEAAINHGGDAGGPWFSDKDTLVKAIKEFLQAHEGIHTFTIHRCNIPFVEVDMEVEDND